MIDFNKPHHVGTELKYIAEAYQSNHISGDGDFTIRCQQILETITDSPKALLTTSCTHALELAALLLNIQPGDEVLLPSFTFVSTINAFVLRGAKPIFVDIRPDTLNLDEKLLEGFINERTRAIVPVHYAGVAVKWMQLYLWQTNTTFPLWKTMLTGYLESITTNRSVHLEAWPPKVSTRPKTSLAAKAVLFSSMTLPYLNEPKSSAKKGQTAVVSSEVGG